jgi:hypothetical protein
VTPPAFRVTERPLPHPHLHLHPYPHPHPQSRPPSRPLPARRVLAVAGSDAGAEADVLPQGCVSNGPPAQRALRWPIPALLAWGLAWALYLAARHVGLGADLAWLLAAGVGLAATWWVPGRWRRCLLLAGFPLSSVALGGSAPAWVWLVGAGGLLLAYPLRAWTDAPFFPTPARALHGLAEAVELPPGARVLDAGCGLGHGLRALHATWPQARVSGVEWSVPMAWWCRWRCRFAQVARGDMWVDAWTGHDVVYLFQRPESMSRAWRKAQTELAPGAWLVSLEFSIPGVEPWRRLDAGAGRPLWIYRVDRRSPSKKARRGR